MTSPPPLPPRSSNFSPVPPLARPPNTSTLGGPDLSFKFSSPQDVARHPPPISATNHPSSLLPENSEGNDPRSSSMQSLRPTETGHGRRRILLMIYIHGFLGDETSFRSFPAHVHNLLATTLAESHAIHTKIYPRYKSRKHISFARDEFSQWLRPRESPHTDIVLVGHSLGGILAAEVTLLRTNHPRSPARHQHRILGLVAVDTPFLGMHPSVVKTGIASLFRTSSDKIDTPTHSSRTTDSTDGAPDPITSEQFDSPLHDPNYNPSFLNDVVRPQRSKLENAWYFWNKHCGELTKATRSYVTSHFEFGGCLADYPGLQRRYKALRELEGIDELSILSDDNGKLLRRVRFVNYYSASTGRIKESDEKSPLANTQILKLAPVRSMEDSSTDSCHNEISRSSSLFIEGSSCYGVTKKQALHASTSDVDLGVTVDNENLTLSTTVYDLPSLESNVEEIVEAQDLPPLPPPPAPPERFDASLYATKDTLTIAQRDHARYIKAYERAKRDREAALRDREKLALKRKKMAAKEQHKREKELAKQRRAEDLRTAEQKAASYTEAQDHQPQIAPQLTSNRPDEGKQKDRKFCALPPKDPSTGLQDTAWVRVYMHGIDEVTAHTSMFLPGDTYAWFVADTAARIEEWVQEDATKDALLTDVDARGP